MGFIDTIKARAKADKKVIVLPETEDRRTYEATAQILKEGIADVVLVGSEEAIKKGSEGLDISGAKIVDPATSEKTQGYIDKLVELRSKKGMTPEQAKIDPRRSVLLQCVGASPVVEPEFTKGTATRNAVYMLCSDGFRHVITPEEIIEKIGPGEATDEEKMKYGAIYLTELVKNRGERDNITVAMVRTI